MLESPDDLNSQDEKYPVTDNEESPEWWTELWVSRLWLRYKTWYGLEALLGDAQLGQRKALEIVLELLGWISQVPRPGPLRRKIRSATVCPSKEGIKNLYGLFKRPIVHKRREEEKRWYANGTTGAVWMQHSDVATYRKDDRKVKETNEDSWYTDEDW